MSISYRLDSFDPKLLIVVGVKQIDLEAVKKHTFSRIFHTPVDADITLLKKEFAQCLTSKK